MLFSLFFDLQPLTYSRSPVLRVVGYGTTISRIVAVTIVALAVIKRQSLANVFRRWTELAKSDDAFFGKCVGHAIFVASFALLSERTLGDYARDVPVAEACLWLLAGALAIGFWLAALAPIRFWAEVVRWSVLPVVLVSLLIAVAVHFFVAYSLRLWYPLNHLTLAACEWMLRLFANDVVSDRVTQMLGTRDFHVEIAPVCSGFEGIALVTISLSLFLILFRKELRFPQAICIVPIGIVAIWLCNVLRIVALILIGAHVSPEIAVGGFHSQAGWIGFAAVTLAIGFFALRFPLFAKRADDSSGARTRGSNSSTAYLLPLLAMIAAAMIAAALSAGFDTLYPIKIVVGVIVLAWFLPTYRDIRWSWSWLAALHGVAVFGIWLGLERFAHPDGVQLADGLHHLPSSWAMVWLVFRAIGSTTVVPIVEELAFRGYLMRRIVRADFDAVSYRECSWLAVLVSSLLFGLLHGRWFAGTLAGVFYAVATRRRDMLCDAITAHGVTNGLIAVYVLWSGSWQLWA